MQGDEDVWDGAPAAPPQHSLQLPSGGAEVEGQPALSGAGGSHASLRHDDEGAISSDAGSDY